MTQIERRIKEDQDAMVFQRYDLNKEPEVCKVFGCGKKLTITEQLYGDKCQQHSVKDKPGKMKITQR